MTVKHKEKGPTQRVLRGDAFTRHEDHYPSPIGATLAVRDEPCGQEVTDNGNLVPIFEAEVLDGLDKGMVLQVAQEELA